MANIVRKILIPDIANIFKARKTIHAQENYCLISLKQERITSDISKLTKFTDPLNPKK